MGDWAGSDIGHLNDIWVGASVIVPGYMSSGGGTFSICPAGTYCVNGVLAACPAGTYSASGAGSCPTPSPQAVRSLASPYVLLDLPVLMGF